MINAIRKHLSVRLFLTYLVVILVGVVVLASSTQVALPGAFNRHMGRMNGWSGMMGGHGVGQEGGPQDYETMQDLYMNFRASFNDALVWAVLAASAAGLVVSLIFSRGVVAPVRAMMTASRRVAEGHYEERVQVNNIDELGQLAEHFNQMASKLEQVETMRRRLIGDVAHELRTPLTTIKGSMEGLMDGVLPSNAETLQQIYQEADRLSRLVDDLQELSRVESGSLNLSFKSASVPALVEAALQRLSRQYKEKGISLTSDLPAGLPRILVDEDRIGQILLNLIGNALQYTPAGGSVHVVVEDKGNEVQISVEDSGIGIPAGHLPHIFDRFYRVDKSRSRRVGGGSGIGLTIARHLVEAHGGRIWAESEGEGKGSAFRFTLPVK